MYIYSCGQSERNTELAGPRNLDAKLPPLDKVARLAGSNTTLEDISAVIGFTATLRLSAWYGDGIGNAYVPLLAEDGQVIARLIGLPAAKALSKEWGGEHLAVPRLRDYEDDMRKKAIARMSEKGFRNREIAAHLRISEKRVQQICRELDMAGLINAAADSKKMQGDDPGKNTRSSDLENSPGKSSEKKGARATGETPMGNLPPKFFNATPALKG